MATATERPKGTGKWYLRVSLGQDPVSGRYRYAGKTVQVGGKREAKRMAAEWEAELRNADVSPTTATLEQLLRKWLAIGKARWARSTYEARETLADRYIIPHLGAVAVRKLRTDHLDELYAQLSRSGRLHKREGQSAGLRPATVVKVHGTIHAALAQAQAWGWIRHNPAANAKAPKVPRQVIDDLPDVADVHRMFDVAAETNPELARALWVYLAIGFRRADLCRLRLQHIDWEDSTMFIHDPKTDRSRTVPVDEATMVVLRDQRDTMAKRAVDAGVAEPKPNAYLFSDALDCSVPWDPPRITQAFGRLRDRCGLRLRLHDLRHLHATHLIDAGVPLGTVSSRLGHSRMSVTADIYARPVSASDRAAAEVAGSLFARAVPNVDNA